MKTTLTSNIRQIENYIHQHQHKRFVVPKPTDSENDVYVIEEKARSKKAHKKA